MRWIVFCSRVWCNCYRRKEVVIYTEVEGVSQFIYLECLPIDCRNLIQRRR